MWLRWLDYEYPIQRTTKSKYVRDGTINFMTTQTMESEKRRLVQQIEDTEATVKPLLQKLEALRRERRDVESRLFIAANSIRRDEIESPDVEGKPWFGHVGAFVEWMKKTRCAKRWASWNGVIYHTSDLLKGKMPDMPGLVEHLPNAPHERLPSKKL
jgi:hypothetical protein